MSRAPAIASDEQALVEACRRGERQALHAFYERYRRRVFSLIARIFGSQDAEELAQEGFLRAFRGLDKFRGEAQLSTWVYRLGGKPGPSPPAPPPGGGGGGPRGEGRG